LRPDPFDRPDRCELPEPRALTARLGTGIDAVAFDWDGTAVANRSAPAGGVRRRIEELTGLGIDVAVVTGTHVQNVERQLRARPPGPGELLFAVNRGSELWTSGTGAPVLLERRSATPAEDAGLDRAALAVVRQLSGAGLEVELVTRFNRRKIDLLPEPAWADPPKARIAALYTAVMDRLQSRGLGGLGAVVELARSEAERAGVPSDRITTDGKHVELGLTDKRDAVRALLRRWRGHAAAAHILIVGDEFGVLDGVPGSDARLLIPEVADAVAVSVGVEPGGGVPAEVIRLPGGPASFRRVLDVVLTGAHRRDGPADMGPPALGRSDRRKHVRSHDHESDPTGPGRRTGGSGPLPGVRQ
jgi:3-deoxy-D-manno-octulosonate 8-phosphate phosphatase KdsC-like HAD superfamily phosphatase